MAPVSGPPVTDEHGEHSNARIGRKRLSKRLLIIAAALALAALAGVVLLSKHNSTVQAASKRRSDAGRPIPVRTAPATMGSVDRMGDAASTILAQKLLQVRGVGDVTALLVTGTEFSIIALIGV